MARTTTRRPTSDAVDILHRRYFEGRPEMMALLEEERARAEMARKVYELRTRAKLTQQQLARRVGTTATLIARLEDSDFEGDSLAMLYRIAAALGRRIELRLLRAKNSLKTA